ncbi:MAG TPA: diguanylate cyclase domain-containing protein [Candidatus Wunengus sp. YC63]|uniref:diguanylate cyclase domain-containing protein n=1 Tax=unclassified Candidatus Wunengus TaxID=3367695 RepID=UPI0040271BD4
MLRNFKLHIEPVIWAIIAIGLLSMGISFYGNWSWQTAIQKHLPLIDNIARAKVDIAEAHLWFEELMGGDETMKIEEVRTLLDKAIEDVDNATEGKSNTPGLKSVSVKNQALLNQLNQLQALIHKFGDIAEKRWQMRDTSGIGSPLDQTFDEMFEDALYNADVADKLAHLHVSTELTKLKWIHGCILALWAVIIPGTSSVLFINSRKRRLLEVSLKKLSSAVEHSPCTVVITDVKGDIEYANPKFTQLTDYTRNEVIGKNPRFLKSGKTPPETYKQLWETITSGYEWRGEFCNQKKNGKLYWESASISPITNIKGMITHFVAVKEDVTERKLIIEALQESEEKLKAILDNTTSVVYVKDISGQYTFINRQYEKLFHVKRDEVKGKTDYDLFPKEMADAFRANDLCVLEAKAPLEFDEVAPHEDGLNTYISIKFPLYDSEGVIYAVCGISTDITERKCMEETIRQMAYHDTLTSLPNRALFEDRFAVALTHAHRNNELLSVMYLDLDGFKDVNDTFGHRVGDRLLQCIAERLKRCLRDSDTIARLGGDEFAVLLPGISQVSDIAHIAGKITESVKQPLQIECKEISVTTSIGIALFPDDGEDIVKLLKHADDAMYRAKENGKNNYRFFSDKLLRSA